jgi:hypothetical protein
MRELVLLHIILSTFQQRELRTECQKVESFLDMLIVAHLVKESQAFSEIRRFLVPFHKSASVCQ